MWDSFDHKNFERLKIWTRWVNNNLLWQYECNCNEKESNISWKHIELWHYFIQDLINQGEICMKFIKTDDQPIDIMTTAIIIDKFNKFKKQLKIKN